MNPLRKPLALLILWMLAACSLRGQQPYWQQQLRYRIDVSLDDSAHSLDGFLKLTYINHSPDSLRFIWFHLWPNAYKNDRTAFSEQMLENGRTDFYFSGREQRGYINRLDFRSKGTPLRMEDHPLYQDLEKIWLSQPLAPGDSILISTPFHVQLPALFSRSGYEKSLYQVTQWYPKPAVYDREGWHPMPYLDQGEFYSEFADYDVRITVPAGMRVAATGNLQDTALLANMLRSPQAGTVRSTPPINPSGHGVANSRTVKTSVKKGKPAQQVPLHTTKQQELRTWHYVQDQVHDFAWFASPYFHIDADSIKLPSGKTVKTFCYYRAEEGTVWKNAMTYLQAAIRFRSDQLGDYPYDQAVVVEGGGSSEGGMEYPGITVISGIRLPRLLDFTIEHEIGHNWFYSALASNERDHPWMDEGMNTYYDFRYMRARYGPDALSLGSLAGMKGLDRKFPANGPDFEVSLAEHSGRGWAIDLPATAYTPFSYNAIVYNKTAQWMQILADKMGESAFDAHMKAYYEAWKFRHPGPAHFKAVMEKGEGVQLDSVFALLQKPGPFTAEPARKPLRFSFAFDLRHTDSIRSISWLPVLGGNRYDGLMAGFLLHNYSLPLPRLRFALAPLYGTSSHQLNGIGDLRYSVFTKGAIREWRIGTGFARFSDMKGIDSSGKSIFGYFRKFSPSIRWIFREKDRRSSREHWLEWKTYLIAESAFNYVTSSADSMAYPARGSASQRYLNQLTYAIRDYRALYPYDLTWQAQQGDGFYRLSFSSHYFLNYPAGGGASLRIFACKFGYLGARTSEKQFATYAYQPKLTAVRGSDDYTYSNYFLGRDEVNGLAGQQIMERDGDLKIRSDLFQDPPVRSDDWVASCNLNTTLPQALMPKAIPLRLFLDIGTYAPAWKKESGMSRFLYVGGLQLSLFRNLVNIYAPLVYSAEFRNNLKSVPEENKFTRKISFSINLQELSVRRLTRNQIPL